MEASKALGDVVVKKHADISDTGAPIYAKNADRHYKVIQLQDGGLIIEITQSRPSGWQKKVSYEYGSCPGEGCWHGRVYVKNTRGMVRAEPFIPTKAQLKWLIRLILNLAWSTQKN
ncbi:MAG: hypothetical protein A3A80_02675 [Candidatus Terrybacteria bacterium RIFCSPLOWO2_01_FULL_44_24]|uniref:Uncharacterized protein n=1 Tax=Candidatus Terrybacteria bacterium RIFCSPHIGHO2_01_FULL_43_35 TaxID=1802361 RepID=A0A1G2PEH5_9BACT|nr:MAG: hypothetical protein A2828_02470 [Candidatus Terrybacteria bacterium RIFCSPHIGHO2_01_FULL_43_35]OHA50274.1 MAG: hypothetical protein A3B75_00525 [Candidatus Terrybacteria bacterium RIFCSPHIGHO2_02_FULL_43_14]OHA50973.1 MAG: hypothetical protein A3A80_02675 [Candidatus Terrybacteria bacterium RIFCSPLOWO2_01_FULL_44_24]